MSRKEIGDVKKSVKVQYCTRGGGCKKSVRGGSGTAKKGAIVYLNHP